VSLCLSVRESARISGDFCKWILIAFVMLTHSTCLRVGAQLAAEAVNFLFDITSRSFWSPPVQFEPGVLAPKAVVPDVCSLGIRVQLPGDPRIRFCNGYFGSYLFFN